ncbi:MAG: DNA-formamidopyrimidine glycosylase [Bacilli bacterium]
MPEIAEVETVRRTLQKRILNKKIKNVNVLYEKMIESNLSVFKTKLIGLEFKDILRKGKWLIFDLGDYYLTSHLRMEGKYFIKSSDEKIEKHEHIIFSFVDGTDLRYHDTRKFGKMCLIKKEDINDYEPIKKQGYEPGSKELTNDYLYQSFKDKNIPMKTLLLDQTIISGLGNIYADEVLFASGINPLKKGKELNIKECEKIVKSSKEIIAEAISKGGTTIRSYTSSLGVTGSFQQSLKVHKREGEKCYNCGTIIERIKVGGRSTYFCPKCQS